MGDQAAADRTANLLLWFLKEPLRYRAEVRRRDAPPLDSEVVLKLALGRSVEFANPALRLVSSAAWREAAAAYVRRVFFRPGATPYQTLGLPPGSSAQAIKENFRLVIQLVHPDRQEAEALWPEAFAAQANRAYGILRNEESRAALDREEDERVARVRAKQQKAAVAAMAPNARWPAAGSPTRRSPPQAELPEWLTAGIGGFMRQHPAVVAFVVLLSGAALVIGAVMWKGQAGSLTREARAPSVSMLPAPASIVAEPAVTATETGALDPPRADDWSMQGSPFARPLVAVQTDPTPTARVGVRASPAVAPAPPAVALAPRVVAPASRVAIDPAETAPRGAPLSGATSRDPAVSAAGTVAAKPASAKSTVATVANPDETDAPAPSVRTASETPAPATLRPVTVAETDALSAEFVDAYDRGRLDTFAALFDDDAETNLRHGRAAIRGEYGELFRLSEWRRMQLKQINWRRVGERAYAKGEIAVRIGWRDGREVEQHVAVDIEVARRDGRVVITRLAHQPSAP